jgi:hypothetical protein
MWSDSTTTLAACDSQIGLNTWLNNGSTGNTLFIITDANGLILDTTSNASFNFAGWAVGDYQVHAMS